MAIFTAALGLASAGLGILKQAGWSEMTEKVPEYTDTGTVMGKNYAGLQQGEVQSYDFFNKDVTYKDNTLSKYAALGQAGVSIVTNLAALGAGINEESGTQEELLTQAARMDGTEDLNKSSATSIYNKTIDEQVEEALERELQKRKFGG